LVKNRAAEKDGITRAPLIRVLRSWPLGSCAPDSRPPPPLCLKVERQGGSGISLSAVDLGALISAVEEVHPRFRTPPFRLKVERRGGSGIRCAPLIRARKSLSSKFSRRLPQAHFASDTYGKWVFNPLFCILTPLQEISLTSSSSSV
jgi:hypothetical protein